MVRTLELEENLGLRYLHASLTAAGHKAWIVDFHAASQIQGLVRQILDGKPDIIGLSMVFTGRADEFVALAKALRDAGFCGHITAGGHYAAFRAEPLLGPQSPFDSIAHGEGERTVVMRSLAEVPVNFGRVEVYGGTELEARLQAEGRLRVGPYCSSYRIADPRAQLAFELYKAVFLAQNFSAGGLTFRAMELDHHLHQLRHFFPERVDDRLVRQTKELVAALNLHSTALLDRMLDFAARSDLAAADASAAADAATATNPALPALSEPQAKLVQDTISRAYQGQVNQLLQKYSLVDRKVVVVLDLDDHGKVTAHLITPSPGLNADAERDFGAMVDRWKFPGVNAAGRCRVELQLLREPTNRPRPWEVCEMMMAPMD